MVTIQLGKALITAVAAWTSAASASGQVLEIGDGGTVVTRSGPTVTTSSGVVALEPVFSATAPSNVASPLMVLPSTGAIRMVPVGELDALFRTAARESGVDARLLHAVAWQESRFHHDRVSPKGAVGIMQLMPNTARDMGVDPRDLLQNLRGGAHLLAQLLRQYGGNLDLTLAAYNAGPKAVRRWGGMPPFTETRTYVRNIRSMLPF